MVKTMKDIMLDLETLGTKSNSVVLSIAAIRFDIDTGEMHPNVYCKNISIDSALRNGLQMDGKTLRWWLEQRSDIMKRMLEDAHDILHVLSDFDLWLNKECRIWGNSARFDLGLLTNCYEKIGLPHPWNFRNERCYRTVISLFPSDTDDIVRPEDAHDPLVDCRYQIQKLCVAWSRLKERHVQNKPSYGWDPKEVYAHLKQ